MDRQRSCFINKLCSSEEGWEDHMRRTSKGLLILRCTDAEDKSQADASDVHVCSFMCSSGQCANAEACLNPALDQVWRVQ